MISGMARKGRRHGGPASNSAPREVSPTDAKLNIRSWKDVADSEDEFHIGRDKILLDEEPARKRQRIQEENYVGLESSEEEVLGLPDEESDFGNESDDDGSENLDPEATSDIGRGKSRSIGNGTGSDAEVEDEDEYGGTWGSSKQDYYNADTLETEQDALEEEQEALRLQKKQLQDMTEADYGFDENEWLDTSKGEAEESGIVQEILPDLKITDDMTTVERQKILESRHPEFRPLTDEFISLQPLHEDLLFAESAAKAIIKSSRIGERPQLPPIAAIKRSALGGYLASLSMYFAILSSGSEAGGGMLGAKSVSEIREHPIMETIMQCRTLWEKVKDIALPDLAKLVGENKEGTDGSERINDTGEIVQDTQIIDPKPRKKRKSKSERLAAQARAQVEVQKAENLKQLEKRLAKIDDRILSKSSKEKAKLIEPEQLTKAPEDGDDNSDFGEETMLTAEEAAEKARRKKGLRFYTSQIAQKDNKREAAGRKAGGDDDIPYRERYKDRQTRLNAEAEARGRNGKDKSHLLEGDSEDDHDTQVSQQVRESGDKEYYDFVANRAKTKKDSKAARAAAQKEAAAQGALARVVEETSADRKGLPFAIEKNKGLTPKRAKDVRNPRVKKRKRFEEKKKKLGSMKPIYKGGEGRGGYGGELTGIKTDLIKSRKL